MNTPARHPLIGNVEKASDEIKAARGKPSSHDFERWARECDQGAAVFLSAASKFDRLLEEVEREEARFIAEQPEQRAQIEAIADEMRRGFSKAKEERLGTARWNQERAQEQRRYAEQTRAFEARFDFDPYTNPLLDAVEKHNAQVLAEQEEKRRKKQRRARR